MQVADVANILSQAPLPMVFFRGPPKGKHWVEMEGQMERTGVPPTSFPTVSTLPQKSPCIVMAPHPCKWLNVLHDSSSNLKALVLMPIRVIPWWPSYFLTPSCQNQLLGSCGPWFLFTSLILWQLRLLNIWGHPLPLCSFLSLPTLLQLMMP